ncbi:MAG: hypothetical protein Q8P05_04985 [Candidatus Diapherotrites archaeon]|nr:hypothetical protein [Candidatus Diapherotrites archaeon]MDZ4256443.1 hypothetical protein [archaeon]
MDHSPNQTEKTTLPEDTSKGTHSTLPPIEPPTASPAPSPSPQPVSSPSPVMTHSSFNRASPNTPPSKKPSAFSPPPKENVESFWNPMRIGAAVIILLMLLSGVAVFIGSQQVAPGDDNPIARGTTVYIAEEVEAVVLQTFPSMIVAGQTSEPDKTQLDAPLQVIPGVVSLTSQYTQSNPTTGEWTYRADIVLTADADKQAIVSAVQGLGLFNTPEIYFQALVRVPTSLDTVDLEGNPRSLTLPSAQIEGLVSPFSQVGDNIAGGIIIFFQDGSFFGATMVESQNITRAPQPFLAEIEGEVLALQPTLSVTGTIDYSPLFTQDYLNSGLRSVPGVTHVGQLLAPQVDNQLFVSFQDANALEGPLRLFVLENDFKYGNPQFFSNGFTVELRNVTVAQAKEEWREAVNAAANATVPMEFQAPLTSFLIDVNTSSEANIGQTALALEMYFAGWDANVDAQVYQSATLGAQEVFIPDYNITLPIPAGTFPGVLLPGHGVGDMVMVVVNGVLIGNEIVFLSGVEDPPEGTQV